MKHIENIIVGRIKPTFYELFAYDKEDWDSIERDQTLFTNERSLARILVEIGFAPSVNEIRRNRPDLMRNLTQFDFLEIKYGKKRCFIAIGEQDQTYKEKEEII